MGKTNNIIAIMMALTALLIAYNTNNLITFGLIYIMIWSNNLTIKK